MYKSIRMLELESKVLEILEKNNLYIIKQIVNLDFDQFPFSTQEKNKIYKTLEDYINKRVRNELLNIQTFNSYLYLDDLYKLEEFDLSFRAYNALKNNGIEKISKIFELVESFEFGNIEGFGSKSAIQAMQVINEIVENENIKSFIFVDQHICDDLPVNVTGLSPLIQQSLDSFNIHTLGDIRKKYLTGELFDHFNRKTLTSILEEYKMTVTDSDANSFAFLENVLINKWFGKVSLDNVKDFVNDSSFNMSELMKRISQSRNLIIDGNFIRLKTTLEQINSLHVKKETKDIMINRFNGDTLQVIANNFGKTRERIRQIVRDRSVQIDVAFEQAFVLEYLKYNWNKEIFKIVYHVDDFSFNVIKYYANKQFVDHQYDYPYEYIKQLSENTYFHKIDMEALTEEINKNAAPTIEIYGETHDLMTKREFLEYVIEKYVPSYGLHKSKIVELANKVSQENNLEYSYDKYIDIVSNTVQGFQNIRYYDYSKLTMENIEDLKKILYEVDSVYSMKYFHKKHPDLMKRINIKDGYELHFILRRLFSESDEFANLIDFNRQPMIALKDMSIFDVIEKHWKQLKEPTNVDEFATFLSKEYGYHMGTLINNINSFLGDYISVKTLYLEKPELTEELLSKIKEILVDDFYELNELEEILSNNGIAQSQYGFFTNFWLNEIGYKTHDINYIIKDHYHSLKEVFFTKVLSEDIYTIQDKDHQMRETTLILFLETLREEYLAFPTKDGKIYTMKYLNDLGVATDDLKEYVRELSLILKKEEYFTYFYLKNQNYVKLHPIFKKVEDYNLPLDIINDLLRNVPGVKKSTKGDLFCITKGLTVAKDFVKQIIEKYNITSKNEIKKIMKDKYGISFKKSEILNV